MVIMFYGGFGTIKNGQTLKRPLYLVIRCWVTLVTGLFLLALGFKITLKGCSLFYCWFHRLCQCFKYIKLKKPELKNITPPLLEFARINDPTAYVALTVLLFLIIDRKCPLPLRFNSVSWNWNGFHLLML